MPATIHVIGLAIKPVTALIATLVTLTSDCATLDAVLAVA